MIITPDTLKALFTGFKKNFQDGLKMAESQYKEIATVIPSSTASNTYGWLGQWPAFREWVGDRVFQDMKAHGYAITNKHFESSVKVNRNDIEDDNVGIYAPMMAEMGRASAVHPDELVFALLKNAHATLCYDGQNFFDTDHTADTPVLDQIAASRGIDADKLKAAALRKTLAYEKLTAHVAGQRQALQSKIEAAKTQAALDKIAVVFTLPEAV